MVKRYAAGIDIGGTKCALTLGRLDGDGAGPAIVWKESFATAAAGKPKDCLDRLSALLDRALAEGKIGIPDLDALGISCGGPLDSRRGIILSPPNLPGWVKVPVVEYFRGRYSLETRLQNDANACALAEWRYGAGRGFSDLVFLTFGTGMGAGIILGGRLHEGAGSLAGEIGHVRLADFGPVGYGKAGSFEGFCSGGGIAQIARSMALERFQSGGKVSFCRDYDGLSMIDAKIVAEAARGGDSVAAAVFEQSGTFLGKGLALILDLLNPEAVILGGLFLRCEDLLRPAMEASLARECLDSTRRGCAVLPAGLGEEVGDYAALALAFRGEEEERP